MTTVKAYCGLARLELAQPKSSRKLNLARDYIEAGLSMIKEILPNSINQVELLTVRGDIELIEKNLPTAEKTFKEALEMFSRTTFIEALEMKEGKKHPILLTIFASLAYIYAENNQMEQAKNFIEEKCLISFKEIYGQEMLDKCTLPSYAFCHLLKAKIMLKSIIKSDEFATAYLLVTEAFLYQKKEVEENKTLNQLKNEEEENKTFTQLKTQMKNPESHEDKKSLDEIKKSLKITKETFNNAFISLKKPEHANKRGTVMLQELGWLHLKSGHLN